MQQSRGAGWVAGLLVCLFGLLGCGGGGGGGGSEAATASFSGAVPVQTVAPGSWVVIGSSSAAGAGAPTGQGWAALVQAQYQARSVTLQNLAIGGTVTYQALPSGSAAVSGRPSPNTAGNVTTALAGGPKLLLVSFPTNDTALGYSVSETVNNLMVIREAALKEGVAVLMLSTQPRNLSDALLDRLVQIDAQLSVRVGECFVPVRADLAGPDGRLASAYDSGDGVHPGVAGHALIAARVMAVIDSGKCVRVS